MRVSIYSTGFVSVNNQVLRETTKNKDKKLLQKLLQKLVPKLVAVSGEGEDLSSRLEQSHSQTNGHYIQDTCSLPGSWIQHVEAQASKF